jgi:hypothetical protein
MLAPFAERCSSSTTLFAPGREIGLRVIQLPRDVL